MNKRGQFLSILFFIGVTIGLLLLAPIILKIIGSVTTNFSSSVNSTSPEAAEAVTYGWDKTTDLFDTAVVMLFFFNIIILLISSFLIDIHPAFVIIYIVAGIVIFALTPTYIQTLDNFYDPTGAFSTEVGYLPGASWIYNNYGIILLGVFFLTGFIMFAKIKYFPSQG